MPNESAKEQLIAKAQKQYIDFVDELKKHDKDYIIENAYKMLKMQDILSILEEGGLNDEQAKLLLQAEYPLEQLYYEWLASGLNENYGELRLVLNEYLQRQEERSMEEQTEKIEILVVEPMIKPYKAVIDNTLDAMQKVVGGYIEPIYLDDVAVVVNEEGKINGSPLNRSLYDNGERFDIAAGTFFVCGLGEDSFDSLTPEQQKKYAEEFYPAEVFYINKKSEIASLKVEPVEKSKAKEAKNKDLEFKKNDLDRWEKFTPEFSCKHSILTAKMRKVSFRRCPKTSWARFAVKK